MCVQGSLLEGSDLVLYHCNIDFLINICSNLYNFDIDHAENLLCICVLWAYPRVQGYYDIKCGRALGMTCLTL